MNRHESIQASGSVTRSSTIMDKFTEMRDIILRLEIVTNKIHAHVFGPTSLGVSLASIERPRLSLLSMIDGQQSTLLDHVKTLEEAANILSEQLGDSLIFHDN